MNIIVVDDEALALQGLLRVLVEIFNEDDIKGFQKSKEVMKYIQEQTKEGKKIDYAFLDIEMRGMNGIEMAKMIKECCPLTRILFVSAYDQYACTAFQLHAKGYILKPATKEAIEETLDSMEVDWRRTGEEIEEENNKVKIKVHTFGNFDISVNDTLLTFERSKSKELLAYLVDRKGSGVTTGEIAAVLWEGADGGKKTTNYVQQAIHSMMNTLKQANISDIIIKKWNYLAIDPDKIECDYYRFLEGDISAVNAYLGEYMSQYSWAEMTTATLEEKNINFCKTFVRLK